MMHGQTQIKFTYLNVSQMRLTPPGMGRSGVYKSKSRQKS